MPHDHSGFGRSASQPNYMFRADIGGKDGGSDHKPAHMTAGQEVIGWGLLLFSDDPPGDSENDGKIHSNDNPIDCLKRIHFLFLFLNLKSQLKKQEWAYFFPTLLVAISLALTTA